MNIDPEGLRTVTLAALVFIVHLIMKMIAKRGYQKWLEDKWKP